MDLAFVTVVHAMNFAMHGLATIPGLAERLRVLLGHRRLEPQLVEHPPDG